MLPEEQCFVPLYNACAAGDLPSVQRLVSDYSITREEFRSDMYAFRQACASCSFPLIRWLFTYFSLSPYDIDDICINKCLKRFTMDDMDDMVWFIEQSMVPLDRLESNMIPFSKISFPWDMTIPDPLALAVLLESVKQGPLVKSAYFHQVSPPDDD